jgi:hypothetical protein
MYYTIYKTTNLITNKIYIGQHITNNFDDGYLGSGKNLKHDIKKYGKENFVKEILFIFDNFEDMDNKEKELITKEFVLREDTYNIIIGGQGFDVSNMVITKDKHNNHHLVYTDDPRYLSGELIAASKGLVNVYDLNGNGFKVDIDDPRIKTGELKYQTLGKVVVKDKDGNTFSVSVNDPRYLSGELQSINKNKVIVKDKDGNNISVLKDDPRYLSGELIHITRGKAVVKDKDNNKFQVGTDDPRYLSGELISIASGKVVVKDNDNNTLQISVDDPRYLSGELVPIAVNKVSVKDKDGNRFQVDIDDPRYLSGELVGQTKGLFAAKDKNGTIHMISKDDPRYLSGELVGTHKGKIYALDNVGNRFIISKDDPRLLTGELNKTPANMKIVKIKNTKLYKFVPKEYKNTDSVLSGKIIARIIATNKCEIVSTDDPRWKTGEIVNKNSGKKFCHNDKTCECKMIDEYEINNFLKNNPEWKLGRRIYDNVNEKFKIIHTVRSITRVKFDDLQKYLEHGYKLGIPKKFLLKLNDIVLVTKHKEEKYINKNELVDYIENGWILNYEDSEKVNFKLSTKIQTKTN